MNTTFLIIWERYIHENALLKRLPKGFESIFGGVTCLPGCFCMYRIKAPKYSTIRRRLKVQWIPVLADCRIVENYVMIAARCCDLICDQAECEVDTLHKKNLYLLGEDRYLSTLMLRTFTKRKMIYVPKAVCHTVVPDSFKVLLSQRRRWINSTIHK